MKKINLNTIYHPNINYINNNYKKPICRRGRLNTGTRCQANCYFCYYKNQLDADHLNYDIIEKEIMFLYESGITSIELSGGESTIHKDFFKILDKCSLMFDHVSMLSNGIKTSNFEFIQKAKDHGLKEILFSLHGSNIEMHDSILDVKAFDHILTSIKHANTLDIIVRVNCIIDTNYKHSFNYKEYSSVLDNFNIKQVNFLPLNYWDDAKDLKVSEYDTAQIKKFIDLNKDKYQINVRYVPICYMKNYEDYCVSTLDHIFDETDWCIVTFDLKESKIISKQSMLKKAMSNRLNTYIKPRECLGCEYILRCDGYEK